MIDIFYHIFDIYEISALSFDLLRASLKISRCFFATPPDPIFLKERPMCSREDLFFLSDRNRARINYLIRPSIRAGRLLLRLLKMILRR